METNDNSQISIKWTSGDVICLFDLFEKHLPDFENQTKKIVWEKISTEMRNIRTKPFTGDQCNGKWKGLKLMYKKVQDHNKTSENSYKNWVYFDRMDRILFKRPEINPLTTCSCHDRNDDREPNPRRIKRNHNLISIKKIDNTSFEDDENIQIPKIPVVEKQKDDFQIFGDYVASEFRALKSEENRRLLRLKIQRAILEVADIDNQETSVMPSDMIYAISAPTAIQLKEEEICVSDCN